jgi:hypothetical protein
VTIRLVRQFQSGSDHGYFVKCNQGDCQYVDENKPPCPLTVALFAAELAAAQRRVKTRPERVNSEPLAPEQ